jgi:hypothetical protein
MKLSRLILSVALTLVISATRAQKIIIRAELDTNKALIGDQIKLHLSIEKPTATQVNFPVLKDTITRNIEIISNSSIDTTSIASERNILSRNLLISVFDTGLFEIPALTFTVQSNGIQDTLNTLPVSFEILAVKADSTIRDIKAIYKVPLSFRELTPYILLALIIGFLTWFLIRYFKNRPIKDTLKRVVNLSEPPDIIALRELELLKEEKPWLHNRVKLYYIRISEIMRTYIQGRFKIMALEQTTDEIIISLKPPVCKASDLMSLTKMLKLADLVKFAKVIPDTEENAAQIGFATEFINNTAVNEVVFEPIGDNESTMIQSNRTS